MPPWPFFSNSSSKLRTPPSRGPVDAVDQQHGYFDQPPRLDRDPSARLTPEPLEPPVLPFASSPSRSHSRSLSGSLFSAGRKKATPGGESASRSSPVPAEAQLDGAGSPKKQGGKGKLEEAEFERGTCATCGTKTQWPKTLSEYRCGTCLMINDLKPLEKIAPPPRGSERLTRSGTHPSLASRPHAPISLERTRAIIDRCIDSYLQSSRASATARTAAVYSSSQRYRSPGRLGPNDAGSVSRSHADQGAVGSLLRTSSDVEDNRAQLQTPGAQDRAPRMQQSQRANGAESSSESRYMLPPSNTPVRPSRSPPPPPASPRTADKHSIARKPVPKPSRPAQDHSDAEAPREADQHPDENTSAPQVKSIFKPVEDYIAQFYANHECLNSSFLLERPRAHAPVHSDENIHGSSGPSFVETPMVADSPLSELDAKTLLVGDFAENALWWTGKDTRANSVGRRKPQSKSSDAPAELVHLRSPLINWPEVHSWYRLIVRAGIDWRDRLKEHGYTNPTVGDADNIDASFAEARSHLLRTLLKAAETLLKRPGRPLKQPSEIRFLLILMANPTLYPAGASPLTLSLAKESAALHGVQHNTGDKMQNRSTLHHGRSPSGKAAVGGFWEHGQAFGIIKRILGLLSNLPNECHRFLTGWFARYDEVLFRQLLTLLQGFVTHRLGRRHRQKLSIDQLDASDLVPSLTDAATGSSAQLHAALGHADLGSKPKNLADGKGGPPTYGDDWQLKAAARIMALLFAANKGFKGKRVSVSSSPDPDPTAISKSNMRHHGQLLSTSEFYNLKVDYIDIGADFSSWESSQGKFCFCQYPFLLSVGMKIRIMELDVQRQMEVSAREAFFDTIFKNKMLEQYLHLRVRRDCLIEDSLTAVDEAVAQGHRETKKALKVQFVDEPGVDAGGLRKEWFLLLVREIFDPLHGMFVYDEDSHLCYFNPHSFETSNQYFLVGALLGFAIYNLTILDVALPPFVFKKLLASTSNPNGATSTSNRTGVLHYTLDDLSEFRPALAKGLRQLLEYNGDVQETFCRDFVVDFNRYGSAEQVPLCPNGANVPVTNANRQEFVDLYVRYLLETQVSRQFEPFKRGFFQVCGGNALSLFQPEEIELLVRGSAEPLNVEMLKAVAVYENWRRGERMVERPADDIDLVKWFWEFFEHAEYNKQRKLLSFITGSDRIPATGPANLVIKIAYAGDDYTRFPIARTCFNSLLLYNYRSKVELVEKLWRAVCESEGFGLK